MNGQILKNMSALSIGRLVILCLALAVLARPISTISLKLTEVKYEFIDDFEKNESFEIKVYVDFELDEQRFSYTNFNLPLLASANSRDYSNPRKNVEDFSPNVQIPPPEV